MVDKSDSERKEKGYVVRALGEKYTYDSNGNLTFDISKNVLISYNKLNLPSTVSFLSKGRIQYIYDSNGNKKIRKVSGIEQGSEETTYYIDNQVYKDGELDYILFKGGRIIINEKDNKKNIVYEYHLKDHLGNVCVASQIDQNGGINIVQKSNYYPFGLKFNTSYNASTSNLNMYGYNGKEEQNVGFDGVKLGWLDYGARMYDTSLGRFFTQDRFAEKYNSLSTYHYGANDPVKHIDVNGDSLWVNYKKERILYENGKLYNSDGTAYSGKGIKKNGKLKGFLGKTVSALNTIGSKTEGANMLSELQSSDFSIDIIKDTGNSYTPEDANFLAATNGAGVGGTVKWSGKNTDVLGRSRPGFIGLGHELAHGQDAARGSMDVGLWFNVATQNGTKAVYNVEKYATHMENMIRAEHGLPLRTQYQPGYKQSRILINATESRFYKGNSIMPYNYNYNSRLNSILHKL